ncbi:hypothetical protein OH720_10255 [Pseudomonas sp. WJP1]|uniref:hypothetical protein n=1 Tax=Pseudomonas sp. WJP1 TaxID=2986947 RepID=UPI002348FF0D|nr:hypothetical protein [Pseudomonas sp. WJP1]WCM53369.1 hypothetical protein OH720_10255 [Pseudomonas sp. WJP1]
MIELFAAIAQILGFALQVSEHLKPAQRNTPVVFQGLLALSSVSKSWKGMHSQYHPLNKQAQSIVYEISEYRNGLYIPKSVEEVAPNELRKRFFDNIINDAVANFEHNTRKEIKDIKRSLSADQEWFQDAMQKIRVHDPSLASDFEELAELKDDALLIHTRFIRFLSGVRGLMAKPRWGELEVNYILDHRSVLTTDLSQMIYVTDKVLMGFLDVYIKLVSEYGRSAGIPTPQPRGVDN